MRPFWLFVVFTAVGIVNGAVNARADFDVSPRAAGGRVTTPGFDDDAVVLTASPQRVFDFAFDDPLDPNFTQDPGFHALSTGFAASNGLLASGLTNGDKLTFDVLSGLQYWNGAGAVSIGNVPAGETLQLALGSASRTIGTGTGSFAGFIIGTIGNANDGDQGLHVHLGSTLIAGTNPQPANGVYLFEMDLKMLGSDGVTPDPNIAASLPFYVLYDHGAPDGAIDSAVDYAQTNLVPEPSGFVLAGIAGLIFCLTQRRSILVTIVLAVGAVARPAPALAVDDISPRLVLGQIATYGYDDAGDSSTNPVYLTPKVLRVFPYFFGDFTDAIGDPYFDNDPGIHALSNSNTVGYIPSGLPTGSVISFDVLSDLQYWSGADPVAFNNVPAGETLNIFLGSRSTTVGTGMGFYPGFGVGAVDATGGLHKHLQAELVAGSNPTPADGVYLFEMRLNLLQSDGITPYPGVKSSLPFFVLFDNNVSISAYQEATTWVQTNLVPFGDFNRDHNVDASDIPAMLNALADPSAYKSANQLTNFDLLAFGDIDSDGKITNADLQALLGFISSGAAMQLVPEPKSWVLLAMGIAALSLNLRKTSS